MEGDNYAGTSAENGEVAEFAAGYASPDGYDATNYADNYYQDQGEGGEYEYDTSYQQEGYDGYYPQQQDGYDGTAAIDPNQYQYNYDTTGGHYAACDGAAGQDYNYYDASVEYVGDQQPYDTENPATWSYSPEEGQQLYLDQLSSEQTSGYYYDEEGNLIDGYGGGESPTSVFNQQEYWDSGTNNNEMTYSGDTASPGTGEGSPQDETDTEGLGLTNSSPLDSKTTDGPESVATPDGKSPRKTKKADKSGRASSPSKKKTKKERVQMRQALLEKEEEERIKALEAAETAGTNNNASGDGTAADAKANKLVKKKPGFVDREKAKFQMKVRIVKAIRRNRMPVQIRILPAIRKHLSPMEKYFGSKSVESVLSDIFWASIKGDIGRVRHLVEVEGESPTDSKLDPWNLHQTPLHWVAKGGSVQVVNYLLAAGASPRSLDENGSLPLHLSCWAGHVDASIVLLRASDVKDLYVQDYDGAMCPLDWVNVRGHTKLLKAIEKFQDSLWLPKFVEELIRGIVRYKIKVFKDPPKKPVKEPAKEATANADANADTVAAPELAATESKDKSPESAPGDPSSSINDSPTKKSFLKRAKTEKADGKLVNKDKKASSKSLG